MSSIIIVSDWGDREFSEPTDARFPLSFHQLLKYNISAFHPLSLNQSAGFYKRFLKGLPEQHRRINDLQSFSRMFLWKEPRTVSKYGKIKLYSNQYPVQKVPHGTIVQVRFDPFDLNEVYIYDGANHYLENTSPSKKLTDTAPNIPEESRKSPQKVSRESAAMFTRLREKYHRQLKEANQMPFSKLFDKHTQEDKNE